jgi:ABC-type transport system involved in multi-copper enzyme maturation permease subunit
MFSTIFKKELLDQVISPKFLIVFLLCLALIPPSLLLNYKSYKDSALEHEFLKKEQKGGTTVVRKPSILSTLAIGLEIVLPKIVIFEKYRTQTQGAQAESEILSNISGKIDFVVIVSFLLGLFAVLYSSTLVVAEKELGTAKLVLANKIHRSVFLFGKYIAGYVVLIIPLFVSFLIGFLLLYFSGFPLFSGENFPRILTLFLLSLLYLSTFFALGLFISTKTHRSSMALLAGFLSWIFFIFVIPKISEPLANLIHPVQGEEVMKMNRSQLRNQIEKEKGKKLSPLYEKYRNKFSDYLKEREPIAKEYEDKIDQELGKFDADHEREKNFNISLSLLMGRLSPALVYTDASLNFCNTGLIDRENFWRSIRAHHLHLTEKFFSKRYEDSFFNEKGEDYMGMSGMLPGTKWPIEWPEFNYKFLTFGETLSRTLPDILLLVIYNLILFAAAYFSFIRYDVR